MNSTVGIIKKNTFHERISKNGSIQERHLKKWKLSHRWSSFTRNEGKKKERNRPVNRTILLNSMLETIKLPA